MDMSAPAATILTPEIAPATTSLVIAAQAHSAFGLLVAFVIFMALVTGFAAYGLHRLGPVEEE